MIRAVNHPRLLKYLPIIAILLLAFALRLRYLLLFVYHIDEYFTLAAAKLIAETGVPRYPTGLIYDPGLPYSYLVGGLFRWLGYSEAIGRWPAVLFGTLAVATVYWLGCRVLHSRPVGWLAALWLALNFDSVEWGGRARMISLAQWLALLSVGLLWLGLTRPSTRHRLLFALSYGLTLLSHFSTVALLPAWGTAAGALWWAKAIKIRPALLRDGVIALALAGLALSSGAIFQPPPSVEFQTSNGGLDDKVGELGGKFLQIPSDLGHAWSEYSEYLLTDWHAPIMILGVVGLLISLIRLRRGQRAWPDLGALFLGVIFVTVISVLSLVIDPHWQRARYLLMQCLGVFYLLGGHGLRELLKLLPRTVPRRSLWQAGLAASLTILLIWPGLTPLSWSFNVGYIGWDRYDLAFKHAAAHMSEGDKIMTMHPPASLIYLGRDDYYLVQSSAKLIVRPDGSLGDRYTGATFVETADQFNDIVARPDRLWLVSQEFWLFNSYDGYLQQNILWRMDKLWGEGGVWALAARPGTWPLARDMAVPVDGEFEGGTRLLGFTANPPQLQPDGIVWLTLFWGGDTIPYNRKVFVQLRDAANNSVAQADHFIYDDKVPSNRWKDLFKNDFAIRDGVTLQLPSELAPGTYHLYVGFYHPETFERVGVVNDQSGEAAVILGEFIVP